MKKSRNGFIKGLLYLCLVGVFTIGLMTIVATGGGGGGGGEGGGGETIPSEDGENTYQNYTLTERTDLDITVDGDSSACYSGCDDYSAILNCINGCAGDPNCIASCFSACMGSGAFAISITIVSSATETVTLTIPAGTVFVPTDSGYQPMMLIEEITITIPAGDTVTECLPVFCLDVSLDAPDSSSGYQNFQSVTGGCLADILSYLEDVDMSGLDYSTISRIQNIIWSCTDPYSEVSQEDWEWLQSL